MARRNVFFNVYGLYSYITSIHCMWLFCYLRLIKQESDFVVEKIVPWYNVLVMLARPYLSKFDLFS
jgi:hypothetical protein